MEGFINTVAIILLVLITSLVLGNLLERRARKKEEQKYYKELREKRARKSEFERSTANHIILNRPTDDYEFTSSCTTWNPNNTPF